jgi:hypothetical protein
VIPTPRRRGFAVAWEGRFGRNGLSLLDLDKLERSDWEVSVYNMIVKKKITSVFERLNNGDYEVDPGNRTKR